MGMYRFHIIENSCEWIRSEIENTLAQDPDLKITDPDEDMIDDIVDYTLDVLKRVDPDENAMYSEDELLDSVHEAVEHFCG